MENTKTHATFSTGINYIIAGFVFSAIHINISFIGYLQDIIAAILFYLGLRLLKNSSKSFCYAYYLSALLLVVSTLLNILIFVSPIVLKESYIYIILLMNIAKILMIVGGLNKYTEGNHAIVFGSLYVIYQVALLAFQSANVGFIVMVVFLVIVSIMVHNLIICRNEIEEKKIEVAIFESHISSFVFICLWSVVVVVSFFGVSYSWPLLNYQYETAVKNTYQYNKVAEIDNLNFFDKVTLYDFNDYQYLALFQYETDNIQYKYSAIDLQVAGGSSIAPQQSVDNVQMKMSNENKDYLTESVIQINQNDFLGGVISYQNTSIQRTYINPFSQKLVIEFPVLMTKGQTNDDFSDCFVRIQTYQYGKIFNDSNGEGYTENIEYRNHEFTAN